MHTFESWVTERREDGHSVGVLVTGDSISVAKRAANLIVDDGEVVDAAQMDDGQELHDGDVLVWTPGDPEEPLRAIILGVVDAGGCVSYDPERPTGSERYADVRIDLDEDGGIESVVRLQRDSYNGPIYELKLAGFTGPPVKTTIVCEDCGHERPTTEENPTLASCENCGSYDLSYKE